MTATEFDDLDGGRNDNDYNFDNWTTRDLDDAGDAVVGELVAMIENVGQYDTTVYLIDSDDGQKMVFGNASINAAVGACDVAEGDMIGIRNSGETYENEHGEFPQFDVRFQSA